MKVNVEFQFACVKREEVRGIQYYIIELLRSLTDRKIYDYSISFFDYHKERNNRGYVEEYCRDFLEKLEIKECNTLDYRRIINGFRTGDHSSYSGVSYSDRIDSDADVFHFPHSIQIPVIAPVNKTVVTVHDVLAFFDERIKKTKPDYCMRFRAATEYLAARKDILIMADSECTKSDLLSYSDVSENRITVVPLSYNHDFYFPDHDPFVLKKYSIHKPYILFLSALDPRKGIDTLINALPYAALHDVQIVLAGTETPSELNVRQLVEASPYKDSIVMTGYVSDYEKRILLSSAEMFVLPSFYEGFGLPILEAMACGTPVITTNVSSLPEVGGDAVLYVSPGEPEELGHAISKMLDSQNLRDDLVEKGYAQCKRFSWDETARMVENVYKELA